ncbi:MAG TPA: hypothetical protein VM165_06530 [Planctomycetaceae bacterium]|nr:hypothetical protein [Planctomycetaceae bacterium]
MSPTVWMRRVSRSSFAFVLGLLTSVSFAPAQETETDDAAAKNWRNLRQAEFQAFMLERETDPPIKLALEPRPVLNWSNPERGTKNGALFLWTDEGRPQMVACAYEFNGNLKQEFHSLSTDTIRAEREGNAVHRFGPGVDWKDLTDAPKAVAQRGLRLTQMRRIAERFRVLVVKSETRLLPQPVYRSPMTSSADVAVFVFVQGTDPECTLLVEATADKTWRYALARQTRWGISAHLDDQLVWDESVFAKTDSPFLVLSRKPAPAGMP